MHASSITGLVLAGGQGSRMGGVDKGLLEFRGEALARHVLRRLAPQVNACMISANRNHDAYAALGSPVCADLTGGYAGPLAGLEAGMAACPTPYLLCAPCDAPFLPTDLAARLGYGLEGGTADLAIAVTGAGAERRRHPVFCLVRTTLLPHLSDFLRQGGRKFGEWVDAVHGVEVEFPDHAGFINLNSIDELRHCRQP